MTTIPKQVATLALAALMAVAANGQAGGNQQHLINLNVVATDHEGHPVAGLQASDLRVTDEGSQQPITSLQPNAGKQQPLVILFDLLNLNLEQRGNITQQIKQALTRVHGSESLYLYLLTEKPSVYAVHGLPAPGAASKAGDAAWVDNVGPLLDQALKTVTQLRPSDVSHHPDELFKATYGALQQMAQIMAAVPGRKQLLWITYGISSRVYFLGKGLIDTSALVRELGAKFNLAGIAIYTMDPGLKLNSYSHEGLEILAAATGGRPFNTSDLSMAVASTRADASVSYTLSYAPPLAKTEKDQLHKVRVTCERKGVRVLAPDVYLEPAS